MSWNYFSSSVTGTSHHSTKTPCQDKHLVLTSNDGKWLAAVVSDGAGSAKFAETGAENTVKIFAEALVSLSSILDSKAPGSWINDFLIEKILRVRQTLRDVAGKDEINEYHCTLVAALVGENGGFSIHIGDGHITGGNFELLNDGKINLNSENIISLPENGEYANETYFITEGNWIKHIRVSPLPALDWITLSSDGGSSLLFDGSDNVKPGFLVPILVFAIDEPQNASKFLTTTISDPKANQLTSDDKTIVVAYRKNKKLSSDKIIYKEIAPLTKDEKKLPAKTKVENIAVAKPSKDSRETPTQSKIINKNPTDKFYSYKLFAKYLAGFFIISLLILSLIYAYQWYETKDNKNITTKKQDEDKNKEPIKNSIPSSAQPASNAANTTQESSKESSGESLKTQTNATNVNVDREKPKTVSGPLDKAASK